jgi:1,4-dihydroxy-6-naphthoate synthase
MKLTLGFSPCPNDTFIFDALIHHKIDTEGLDFDVFFEDVESLNKKAFSGDLDITKLSFHVYAYVLKDYVLLDAGSALGFGVGPLLISKHDLSLGFQVSGIRYQVPGNDSSLPTPHSALLTPHSKLSIGIPGKYTTANLLLSMAYPELSNKTEMVFSEIEDALLKDQIDLGVIIHENRFTYESKGLQKVTDLGEYWEVLTGSAIPLGGIVVKRNLPADIKHKVNRVLKRSVEFAFQNPRSGLAFIRNHAQEMSEEVMYKHIELYVNKYSIELGEEGRKAIKLLFDIALEKKIIPKMEDSIFLT